MEKMCRRTALLLAALSLFLALDCSNAFVLVKRPVSFLAEKRTSSSTLLLATSGGNSEEEDETSMDVEEERKRLESLLGDITQTEESNPNDKLLTLPISEWKQELKTSKPPLLTSIGRERLELEISLLESLAESDSAIPELWNLWYAARGPQAAKDLMRTETLVGQGQPAAWKRAERLLKELIAREGIHWVEPVNRLATLMFLQSRHEESKELCEIVLQLKPWHFGALSGMVMVMQGLQDPEGMLDCAKKRMPPLPKKGADEKEPPQELALELETRQMWVDRMLDRAKSNLLGLEMGLEESFADLDSQEKVVEVSSNNSTSVDKSPDSSQNLAGEDEEDDAWQ